MDEINEAIARSVDWLIREQHTSGGWGQRHGMDANALNTAEALIALLDANDDIIQPGAEPILKGVNYLLANQKDEDPESAYWARIVHRDGKEIFKKDVVRTALAIQALLKAGHGVGEPKVSKGVHWLLKARKASDTWGFGTDASPDSDLMPTCVSAMALLDVCRTAPDSMKNAYSYEKCVLPSVEAVVKRQAPDGHIGQDSRLTAAHTIYSVLLLQKVRRCHHPAFVNEERRALDWLLQHKDAANKLIEEEVVLSPGEPDVNYQFLYMTDTLLARALAASERPFQESRLATDTLIKIKDRLDPDGGVYGPRLFSWATAKTVTALSAVAGVRHDFPQRDPEVPGARVGPVLILLDFGFAIAVVALSFAGVFGPLQAMLFMFLMLTALLAYGRIGEQTFREITLALASMRNTSKDGE